MLMILLRVVYNPVFVNGDGTLYIFSHHQLAEMFTASIDIEIMVKQVYKIRAGNRFRTLFF
jgi:hypothetical protein